MPSLPRPRDVRSQFQNPKPDVYLNIKEMPQNFSKEIIYMKLLPPYMQTLFVEPIRFTPGVPENSVGRSPPPGQPVEKLSPRGLAPPNGTAPQALPHPRVPHPPVPLVAHLPHRSALIPPSNSYENGKLIGIADPSSSRHLPPPPPWSNQIWSNAAVTAPAPGARPHPEAHSPHITSPHVSTSLSPTSSSRKRTQ